MVPTKRVILCLSVIVFPAVGGRIRVMPASTPVQASSQLLSGRSVSSIASGHVRRAEKPMARYAANPSQASQGRHFSLPRPRASGWKAIEQASTEAGSTSEQYSPETPHFTGQPRVLAAREKSLISMRSLPAHESDAAESRTSSPSSDVEISQPFLHMMSRATHFNKILGLLVVGVVAAGAFLRRHQILLRYVHKKYCRAAPTPSQDHCPGKLNLSELGRTFAASLGVFAAVACTPDATLADAGGSWNYKLPTEWQSEFPSCKGEEQSPVALARDDVTARFLVPLKDKLSYRKLDNISVNNGGKTVQVNGDFGSFELPDGNYKVKQFHFHFPAEHKLNGKLPAGELHIVHQRDGATGTDGLAVVGIFLDQVLDVYPPTPEFSFLEQLGFLEELPASNSRTQVEGSLDLNAFQEEFNAPYYHYKGSLTTPPCSEGVHWYVVEKPVQVTKQMIKTFKQRFSENNRPIQPIKNRLLVKDGLRTLEEF